MVKKRVQLGLVGFALNSGRVAQDQIAPLRAKFGLSAVLTFLFNRTTMGPSRRAASVPQISVKGLDAYYRDEGTGVPVVLGHSSSASSGQWRELIKRLSGRYRLVAPDHIGYGRTAAYSGDMPLMEHEIAIVEALVRLQSDAGRTVHRLSSLAAQLPGQTF
jgi:hypothetical protein